VNASGRLQDSVPRDAPGMLPRARASAVHVRTTSPLRHDPVAAPASRCAAMRSSIVVCKGWPLCEHSQ
jgi:hypothetical protein